MNKSTGGSAFPGGLFETASCGQNDRMPYNDGMTLLDYFAAKELSKADAVSVCDVPQAYERLADHCYRMAVAMVKEREKYLK